MLRTMLMRTLSRDGGYAVVGVATGEEGLAAIETQPIDLIFVDLVMPGMGGLELIRRLEDLNLSIPIIAISGSDVARQRLATSPLGVDEFLPKPLSRETVLSVTQRHLAVKILDSTRGRSVTTPRYRYGRLVSSSRAMKDVFDKLKALERVDVRSVLVTGESGSGKEIIARTLHARGERSHAPFVEVDCTTLPSGLVETSLFGNERGAFTDAKSARAGLLEAAGEGVLFLDEVGELPLEAQAKLLRALENRVFKRVGGTVNLALKASVIAATHRDLADEVKAGRFRSDLYYRLAVVPLHIPPLRERLEDVWSLLDHFLEIYRRQFGRPNLHFRRSVKELLMRYQWPGNVRELRNLVERLAVFVQGDAIDVSDLPAPMRQSDPTHSLIGNFKLPAGGVDLQALEESLVRQAMDRAEGRKSEAAQLLGVSRFVLRNRLKKYGID